MDGSARIAGALTLWLMATWWTGCTGGAEDASAPGSTPPRSVSPTSEPTGEPTPTSPVDALRATPAKRPYGMGGAPSPFRAGNGTTLVIFEPTWPAQRTSYRLYDRRWRPRTPLLRVDVVLRVQRGTDAGFVGRATITDPDGSNSLNEWVTIDRAGRVRQVAHQPDKTTPAQPPRPTDLHLEDDGHAHFAYRPTTDTILRKPKPQWDSFGHSWYIGTNGTICAGRSGRPLSNGTIHVSTDEGRTFTDLAISGIIPAGSGPLFQACNTTAERILVQTGGEEPLWLHTLDRNGRQLFSSRRLGGLLNPYGWDTLPDGRLVTGTNRPGLMVATDATNQLMDYRPGPVSVNEHFDIVGDQILVMRRNNVHVSRDAGLTWQKFDLQLP